MKRRMREGTAGLTGVLLLGGLALGDEDGRQPTSAPGTRPTVLRTEEDLGPWLTNYYLHPTPEQVVPAVRMMAQKGYLTGESTSAPFGAFLAAVFRSNPARVAGWLEELHALEEADRRVVYEAAWMADDAVCRSALERAAEAYPEDRDAIRARLGERPPNLFEAPIREAGDLDKLWGGFFATGDERYIVHLMSALPRVDEEDVGRMLVGSAARWSLGSNAKQHPRVLEICRARVAEQPPNVRKHVEEIIAKAAPTTQPTDESKGRP